MIQVLHAAGYEKLRLIPSEGPNCNWRAAIVPVTHILTTHGAWGKMDEPAAYYNEMEGNLYFGWRDARYDDAKRLAKKFIKRFPLLCRAGFGSDGGYVRWFAAELMPYANRGELPCVVSPGINDADPRYLPTRLFVDSGLPMPPVGEMEPRKGVLQPEMKRLDRDALAAPIRRIPYDASGEFMANFEGFASKSPRDDSTS
jgi:hypothetical protein